VKSQIQFQQKGYFGGRYTTTFTKYEGFDFSRRGFVFPGQSSAFPGMMKEELTNSPVAVALFKKADELAAKLDLPPVSDYVFNPERLSNPNKALLRNPALFTVQVAIAQHLESIGLTPALVTGHSFGEYAAVVISEIGKFEDLFEIVVMRDRFSPDFGVEGN
jgi:malonyl CoA-acyl carrier protein transacylase